jgi:hypothetical protein
MMMKTPQRLAAALLLALVGGCRSQYATRDEPAGAHNLWVNAWFQEQARDAAIVRQATLFADEFVPGTAELTDLGVRDLGILIGHYGRYGGTISVRRGGVSDSLYAARVAAVQDALVVAGVAEGVVEITDELPRGPGLASANAADALAAQPFDASGLTAGAGTEGGGR